MKLERAGANAAAAFLAGIAIAGCANSGPRAERAPDSVAVIEIRLVRDEASRGAVPVDIDGTVAYLDARPLLTDEDLIAVMPEFRAGQLLLRYEATTSASAELRSRTAAEVGSRIAVLLDGEVRTTSRIMDAIGGRGNISVSVSEEDGRRLAALVRAKWPQEPSP